MATTLSGKIALASIEVGNFKADKTNQDQKYSYISADQVLSRAGDALAKQGIAVLPSLMSVDIMNVERQGKSPRLDAKVTYSMTVTDGEKEIIVPWFGFGSDYLTPDKAVYKAITSGHKYFLMKLLNIGIGNEDGEHEVEKQLGNPDPVTDEIWKRWLLLCNRADALNVEHSNPKREDVTKADLTTEGLQLLEYVKAAEYQAQAGTEAQ
jgi:hypothetical protein